MFRKQTFDNNIYMKLFRWVYIVLMTSVCFTLTILPFFLAVLLLAIDSRNVLPFIGSLLFFGPAMPAVFSVIDSFKEELDVEPVHSFFKAYRRFWLQGLLLWLPGLAGTIIAAVDILFFIKVPNGQWLMPFFFILAAMGIALSINCWYFQMKNPTASIRAVFQISMYYIVKKWYISLLNVVLYLLIPLLMLLKPQFGFIITPSLLAGLIYLNAGKLHGSHLKQQS
ncbi:DUF624 domain-containing protein [Enterococcus sp. BWM-S5]|uniref:DUF624 domain-containing protein n=1 Tax=Enterococcus larvae TaxID=2794352 RepID=A0ABS4CIC5_9ENTE|nr:DUF624 domain-containing protein [Enterococcus larvae]MBP1045866.1 DUF624 domain-containing protein [Enterococcus larvae]